jgi:hypothetical protein
MATSKASEPRAHHFVPQCWLAGFTDTGQKDGQIWVTDLARKKQWRTSPANAGHHRDFYRISDPKLDPVVVEKTLSRIENAVAPLLKTLGQGQREPTEDELEVLVWFMAIQWVRVPAFRPTLLAIADSLHRSQLSIALKSRESWAAALKDAGIPADSPGADYDAMREFERSGQYSLTAEPEWYLQRGFAAVPAITRSLMARRWAMSFSKSGSFIGSDSPVALDGPKDGKVGFKNAEIVTYSVSRYVLLYGTKVAVMTPFVSRKYIAHTNTFAMLTAEAQVYSHTSDFCWLDETHRYQTDWRLFSKEKFQ